MSFNRRSNPWSLADFNVGRCLWGLDVFPRSPFYIWNLLPGCKILTPQSVIFESAIEKLLLWSFRDVTFWFWAWLLSRDHMQVKFLPRVSCHRLWRNFGTEPGQIRTRKATDDEFLPGNCFTHPQASPWAAVRAVGGSGLSAKAGKTRSKADFSLRRFALAKVRRDPVVIWWLLIASKKHLSCLTKPSGGKQSE